MAPTELIIRIAIVIRPDLRKAFKKPLQFSVRCVSVAFQVFEDFSVFCLAFVAPSTIYLKPIYLYSSPRAGGNCSSVYVFYTFTAECCAMRLQQMVVDECFVLEPHPINYGVSSHNTIETDFEAINIMYVYWLKTHIITTRGPTRSQCSYRNQTLPER